MLMKSCWVLPLIILCLSRPALANVVGSDAQNFNPTTSGLDFVTVQTASTLEPGIFNLGLFTNYAKNSLPYYDSTAGGAKRNSALTGGDLNFGIGLTKNWDFGLSFPFILNQQVDADSSIGRFSSTGNTEVRANTKLRILGTQRHGFALIPSANFNRISKNPYVGEGGGPIYNLEMAYKVTFGLAAWGLNLGYRWRKVGKPIAGTGIEPLADQWLASTALSYRIDSMDSKIVMEVFAAFPKHKDSQNVTDRQNSVVEALLGLKYDSNTNLSFHFGAGGGLTKGTASPDYRVYAGLNYAFGSVRGKRSAQVDPYAAPRPPKPTPAPTPVAHAKAQQKPQPKPLPSVSTQASAPTPPPPPVQPEPAEPVVEQAVREVPPAVSTETVSDVKVFNRGAYNHIVLQNIEFVGSTMSLKPESLRYLINELIPALRELLKRKTISSIIVEGHTDSIGNPELSMQLSRARAQIVTALLRQRLGVKVPIQAVGAGSSNPIADNSNYQGRAQNQRVEIKLINQPSR